MTVPAQGGIFAFALQAAKIGAGNTFDPSTVSWYKMRVRNVAVDTIQDQQVFPLEVGGVIVPTGEYKQAKFFGGQVDIIPRLENTIGFILKAAMGSASSVTGKDPDGNTLSGVNSHIFRFDPTSSFIQPWCAVRRMSPGNTTSDNLGTTGYDAKVTALTLGIPAMGKVTARVGMIGRDTNDDDDASTWTYANANFEDSLSTADAGRGSFKIGGTAYPIMGATIELNNGLTTPQQEMIIGSFNPDDFVALTRGMTIRIVYKVKDYALYRSILNNGPTNHTWSSLPFIVNSAGGVYAFDGRFQAPTNIGVTSTPYELRVRANSVAWSVDGPISLQAGGIVTQTFIGTVLDAGSSDYAQITLENAQTSY